MTCCQFFRFPHRGLVCAVQGKQESYNFQHVWEPKAVGEADYINWFPQETISFPITPIIPTTPTVPIQKYFHFYIHIVNQPKITN